MSLVVRIVVNGAAYTIYAVEEDGGCEVLQFLQKQLRHGDAHARQMMALLRRTAQSGLPANPQSFKWVGSGGNPDEICEFKQDALRLFGFAHTTLPKTLVLAHGWSKSKAPGNRAGQRKQQTQQIEKAEEVLRRHRADPETTIVGEEDDG